MDHSVRLEHRPWLLGIWVTAGIVACMRFLVLLPCVLSVLAYGQQPSGEATPATMTKLVVRLESPDVPKASFPSLPKTMYRAGTRYCRIEELPDTEHAIHLLIIINEPNVWLANRLDKTARHQIDPGPTFNCRMTIFTDIESGEAALDTSNPLTDLEFGRELEYFKKKGATLVSGPNLQGKATKGYTLQISDSRLFLFTGGIPEHPVAVVRQRNAKREIYWYGSYDDVPFDGKLFEKPPGKIEEVK